MVREQAGVSDKGVAVGGEELAPEPDLAGVVSAPVVGLDFLIKLGLPATTSVAPSVVLRW